MTLQDVRCTSFNASKNYISKQKYHSLFYDMQIHPLSLCLAEFWIPAAGLQMTHKCLEIAHKSSKMISNSLLWMRKHNQALIVSINKEIQNGIMC